MIKAKVICDSCGAAITLPMVRCYEEGEWRIEGLSWSSLNPREPKKLAGWDYDMYLGPDATCPKCQVSEVETLLSVLEEPA